VVQRLASTLAHDAMADALLGSILAAALLPACAQQLQCALWSALREHSALHLLPAPGACIGGWRQFVAGRLDPQLTAAMARSLQLGELAKAMQLGSLSADLAVAGAAAALDRAAWGATGAPARVAGNLIRGLVGDCEAAVVRRVVEAARDVWGVAAAEVAACLLQSCEGDVRCMERCRQVLVTAGML